MRNSVYNDSIGFLDKAIDRNDETVMLEKILLKNKVCIINGMAGIGKTYFVKMYSYSHENVVYTKDYYFYNCNLENRIIDHSFAKSIKNNTILVIDDIDEDISSYVHSSFFANLKKIKLQNIILLTRQNIPQGEIPILTLRPFTLMQIYELIKIRTGNRYLHTEMEQIARLSNGNPVMIEVICLLMKRYSNIDKIREQLSLPENKRLIYPFIQNILSTPVLNDSEKQTYVEIIVFGKIEKSLLMRWDSRLNEEIEKDIAALMTKGLISFDEGLIYGDYLAGDILDDYPQCLDFFESISLNMKNDILNGISVDDKHAIALISMLKAHYEFVDFIVTFYEQKFESQKEVGFTESLSQILQRLGRLEVSVEKNVIPQVAKIDKNIEKLVETQNQIQSIINQLTVGFVDNKKALEALEDLSQLVKNPQKSKWDRVNACVGFLGSVATLATFNVNGFTANANDLISQLNSLINMLPFMHS